LEIEGFETCLETVALGVGLDGAITCTKQSGARLSPQLRFRGPRLIRG
jgi:hypothetical protein